MQNQAFYQTGIFGNFFFGGGNFAFSIREFPVALLRKADLGIHIWGGKLFRGPEGRERGWGQLGIWERCELS